MDQTPAGPPRVVVLGCGNPSRGDDALGPALMERVEAWTRRHPDRAVTVVEDFQFQVEHALDLQGQDLALFVDAATDSTGGVSLQRVKPSADFAFSTHSVSPGGVLATFLSLGWVDPPPAFSLAVGGRDFGLGRTLSPGALRNLEHAWSLLDRLLEQPSLPAWEVLCGKHAGRTQKMHPAAPPGAGSSGPV